MQATVGIFGGWIWLKWNVSAALKIDKSSRWFQGNINGLIRYVQLEIGGLHGVPELTTELSGLGLGLFFFRCCYCQAP